MNSKHLSIKFAILFIVTAFTGYGKDYSVSSPSGKLKTIISCGKEISLKASLDANTVLKNCPISVSLDDGRVLGKFANSVENTRTAKVNTQVNGLFYKKATVTNVYNELTISFKGRYGLIVRAYDEGFAYRWFTLFPEPQTVTSEEFSPFFEEQGTIWQGTYDLGKWTGSFETSYDSTHLSKLPSDKMAFLPVVVKTGQVFTAITEADLVNYPGMFLASKEKGSFYALHAQVGTDFKGDTAKKYRYENFLPNNRAPYIAKLEGNHTFPWRVFTITDKDEVLLDNDLVFKLARPSMIQDPSWIKPGKVAWDWWHNWTLGNLPFVAGINTATYKAYIDFAAEAKLDYILLDEGWSKEGNPEEPIASININEIVRYGQTKGIGVWLWMHAYNTQKNYKRIFEQCSKWGIKGLKIDFFDRDDQTAIQLQETMLAEAATKKLMIDYHGISKPTGLNRTWPNELTREGVMGAEFNKWSNKVTVKHNLTIPFVRMIAGPMDYTPGATRHWTPTPNNFRSLFDYPMVMGSRSHELAKYIVYESPLAMLADAPQAYRKEPEMLEFLKQVPTVWDETRVLTAKFGEYLITARRKEDIWFIAGMCAEKPQILSFNLPFTKNRELNATLWRDGLNANKYPADFIKEEIGFNRETLNTISLIRGGGFVMIVGPKKQ